MPLTQEERIMTLSPYLQEVAKRRTFAIISHPDAGKTTITETVSYTHLVSTMAFEEIELSTLSIPNARPSREESSSTNALSAPCCKRNNPHWIQSLSLIHI